MTKFQVNDPVWCPWGSQRLPGIITDVSTWAETAHIVVVFENGQKRLASRAWSDLEKRTKEGDPR